jgi:hypothetical protein
MVVDCNGVFQIETFLAHSDCPDSCDRKAQERLTGENFDRLYRQLVKKFVIFTQLLLTQLNICGMLNRDE